MKCNKWLVLTSVALAFSAGCKIGGEFAAPGTFLCTKMQGNLRVVRKVLLAYCESHGSSKGLDPFDSATPPRWMEEYLAGHHQIQGLKDTDRVALRDAIQGGEKFRLADFWVGRPSTEVRTHNTEPFLICYNGLKSCVYTQIGGDGTLQPGPR